MSETFDIVVIGGGTAGCVVAARLAQDGRYRVKLLEAGASDLHPWTRAPALAYKAVGDPRFDWRYAAEPDRSRGARADVWCAGKRLGGSSAIGGGMFLRGHPYDYDHWEELGARGWDWLRVLPYFKKLEASERGGDAYRGGMGPIDVVRSRSHALADAWLTAAAKAGIPSTDDLNGILPEGAAYADLAIERGWRASTAAAYLGPLRQRTRLSIALGAVVTRILFEGGRAAGAEYQRGGNRRTVRARRGVVLCAGAIASPQLLMLSGIGPGEHLRAHGLPVVADLAGVGTNLQIHAATSLASGTVAAPAARQSNLSAILELVRKRNASASAHALALVRTKRTLQVPNIAIAVSVETSQTIEQIVTLLRPQARGNVRLNSSRHEDAPVIAHELLGAPNDVDQLIDGAEIARRILAEPERDRAALEALVLSRAMPAPGAAGTCRMGDDESAVVSPELRLRGVDGLWIVDASVMPALPGAGLYATAIMIAEKGADHILTALRREENARAG